MENQESNINNLIALCHIIDDFEDFDKKVISMLSTWNIEYNKEFIKELQSISTQEKCFIPKWDVDRKKIFAKAKKFYGENKSVIDTINQYSNIWAFIGLYYDSMSKSIDSLDYYEITHTYHEQSIFFYKYILKHKEDIEQILALLESIKELGFLDIELNEDLDFVKEIYTINPNFKDNKYIIYVANAKAIVNHPIHIDYKTINSNYKISLKTWGDDFYPYPAGKVIILNSLIFDSKSLPKSLNKEDIFESILRLKSGQEESIASTFVGTGKNEDVEESVKLVRKTNRKIEEK